MTRYFRTGSFDLKEGLHKLHKRKLLPSNGYIEEYINPARNMEAEKPLLKLSVL